MHLLGKLLDSDSSVMCVARSSLDIAFIHSWIVAANISVTSSGRTRCESRKLSALGIVQRLCQQLVEQQHLDATAPHQIDEAVELLARATDPDDIVEQQVVTVRR